VRPFDSFSFQFPVSSRPALGLAGRACRALESGHPGNAPAGLPTGPGTAGGKRLWTALASPGALGAVWEHDRSQGDPRDQWREGRVGGEYAMERRVASRGDPGARQSPRGQGTPPGASPTAPLGPCRSRACPVDYPVRGGVRNPDDPDEAAGAPGAGGWEAAPRRRPAGAGYLGLALGGSTRRPARPGKPGGIDAARGSEPERSDRRLSRVTDTKFSSDKKISSRTQPSHPYTKEC
jgi:hypothetical protein